VIAGRPERLPIVGDVRNVGMWTYEPTAEELAPIPAPTPQPPIGPRSVGSGRSYAERALEREVERIASTPRGRPGSTDGINITLNCAARRLGQLVAAGELERSEVEHQLFDAAVAAASAAGFDPGCGAGRRASLATIKSGLDAGKKKPRVIPPLKFSPRPPHTDADAPPWIQARRAQ